MICQHWQYLITLDSDLHKCSRFVDINSQNFKTYSIEFVRILLAAGSEIDVVAKILCKSIDSTKSYKDINDYRRTIVNKFQRFPSMIIDVPQYELQLTPWNEWSQDKNPDWWRAYNDVKHKRHNHFADANLENTLNAVAGLFVIIHNGPGTIYQDKNGVLNLKSYAKTTNVDKEISHMFKSYLPGKIIGNEDYFSLRATDMSGNEWCAENIWPSSNTSLTVAGQIIKAELREIKNITEVDKGIRPEKAYLFIVVPGSYRIPCNKKEDLPNGGWRLNKSLFSANLIDFEFKKLDKYLTIDASADTSALLEQSETRIIEALSIVYGQIVRPMIVVFTHDGIKTLEIKSVDNTVSNKHLPYPIEHSLPSNLETFTSFLGKYLCSIENPYSELFGFWYKINRAWQADIENASLSLAVAIEGVAKLYFKRYGLPDKEILQQAQEAKRKIKDLELGKRIKSRILSSLDGLKSTSPKGAFYQMSETGLFPKSFVDEWVSLRNKSTHADQIDQDNETKQTYIDQIYTCITLFYCLLFKVIGYEGNSIDYSQEDWPEKRFPLTREE